MGIVLESASGSFRRIDLMEMLKRPVTVSADAIRRFHKLWPLMLIVPWFQHWMTWCGT